MANAFSCSESRKEPGRESQATGPSLPSLLQFPSVYTADVSGLVGPFSSKSFPGLLLEAESALVWPVWSVQYAI